MKNITNLFVSALLMITVGFSANATEKENAKHKKQEINERINTLIGSPTELLNGTNQSVIISYDIDESNVMHIKDIATSNLELKNYIMKRLDGKRLKNMQLSDNKGIVKVHFIAQKQEGMYFQY